RRPGRRLRRSHGSRAAGAGASDPLGGRAGAARLSPMTDLLASLLHAMATAVGRLPWPLQRALGDGLGGLARRLGARESVVALRNLELALPALDPAARQAL